MRAQRQCSGRDRFAGVVIAIGIVAIGCGRREDGQDGGGSGESGTGTQDAGTAADGDATNPDGTGATAPGTASDADADATATADDGTDTDTGGPEACRFEHGALRYDWAGVYALPDTARGIATGDLDEDGFDDLAVATGSGDRVDVFVSGGDWRTPTRTSLDLGQGALAVRLGDMNDDGHLDLVTSGVNVYLGDGAGGLSHLGTYSDGLHDLVLADLDGDGDLDVATVSVGGQSTSVLHNDGSGALSLADSEFTWFTECVDAGDVDGDGDIDLVIGTDETTASDLKLLRNQGDGTFAAYEPYGAIAAVEHVRLADLDDDDDLDVVLTDYLGTPWWFENDGSGNFDTQHEIDVGSFSADGLDVADLDGDGDVDLAAVGDVGATVYENDGLGGFTPIDGHIGRRATHVDLGDVDGDGMLDIATIGQETAMAMVMLGDGVGVPRSPSRWPSSAEPRAAVLGDFDGDDRIDLALGVIGIDAGFEIGLDIAGADVAFLDPDSTDDAFDVAAADFDGDGRPNPIAAGESSSARVLVPEPGGGFSVVSSSLGSRGAQSVTVGEVSGDAHVDALVMDDCYIRVGLGLGNAELESGGMLSVDGGYCNDHALADLDGDGHLDVLAIHYGPSGVTIFPGLGGGEFGEPSTVALPDFAVVGLAVGDADGDGDPDAFVVWGPALGYLRNDAGALSLAVELPLPTLGSHVEAGDLDGDGDVEAVVSSTEGDRLYLVDLLAGRDLVVVREHGVLDPEGVAIGDADGDCVPDLAVAGGASESAALLRAVP
jgi:hypothetical protein